MKIESKNFVLMPRHLRRFNGSVVQLFDGRKGKITYPYLIVSDGNTKLPVMIERKENFQEIRQILKKGKSGYSILAERKSKFAELRVL
ncbi:hypothetical protein F4V47_06445 [Lactococcus garvieae subsp. garvieae]|uniref:hypothetical protein n=1 Tax=Lactococcus garvieae TaxID=1363 RepID=UPI0005A912C7|nr:hypothetical protein [Lactococcus garvieae]KAA8712571.1 hypothetical protein F4V47_06445 [Lactococcus garvieae subsp. garvieae]MDG6192282.1 hypothetical protein [Lactococcus garvieae]QPR48044.1 hypothetical protein I6G86_00040 [Lactococcus garvieae]